jgi:hypothetical protein
MSTFCAVHTDMAAVATCARCGTFGCLVCIPPNGGGLCEACREREAAISTQPFGIRSSVVGGARALKRVFGVVLAINGVALPLMIFWSATWHFAQSRLPVDKSGMTGRLIAAQFDELGRLLSLSLAGACVELQFIADARTGERALTRVWRGLRAWPRAFALELVLYGTPVLLGVAALWYSTRELRADDPGRRGVLIAVAIFLTVAGKALLPFAWMALPACALGGAGAWSRTKRLTRRAYWRLLLLAVAGSFLVQLPRAFLSLGTESVPLILQLLADSAITALAVSYGVAVSWRAYVNLEAERLISNPLFVA